MPSAGVAVMPRNPSVYVPNPNRLTPEEQDVHTAREARGRPPVPAAGPLWSFECCGVKCRTTQPSVTCLACDTAHRRPRRPLESLLEEQFALLLPTADIYKRAEILGNIKRLLSEETDPYVRLLGKAYVDRLAGRLDSIGSVEDLAALERSYAEALVGARSGSPQ